MTNRNAQPPPRPNPTNNVTLECAPTRPNCRRSILPHNAITKTIAIAIAISLGIGESATSWASPISPSISDTAKGVSNARGPDRYTALRKLWGLWDNTDPTHVEQAIRTFTSDPSLDGSSRVYSGLLGAYARRRRGDIHAAKAEIAGLGFVSQWMVIGPFDNEGRGGLDRVFEPEANIDKALDPSVPHEGKERQVRWRSIPDVFPFGWLDFGDLVRPSERVCAYASTFVRNRNGGPGQASVWLGATGSFRAFWNGEEVVSDSVYRVLDAERFGTTVEVKSGWNRLVVKVCGDSVSPMLTLRVGDRAGGVSHSLEVSADPAHADAAA
ncbi:MAG: hypothetical protein FWD57_05495, partial [Polyangiaceae bacterium]|nr:hypothetical protein [Polyangiaceae bacterium]